MNGAHIWNVYTLSLDVLTRDCLLHSLLFFYTGHVNCRDMPIQGNI